MESSKNNNFKSFISAMTKAQLALKGFIRHKLKQHNLDLTFEMLQVLINLWEKQGFNQQELANVLHKDKASLTPLIDNLSKRGLVQRSEDPDDRRNKLITLTPKGKELENQITPWLEELYSIAGNGLTAEEIHAGVGLFEKIASNFTA